MIILTIDVSFSGRPRGQTRAQAEAQADFEIAHVAPFESGGSEFTGDSHCYRQAKSSYR